MMSTNKQNHYSRTMEDIALDPAIIDNLTNAFYCSAMSMSQEQIDTASAIIYNYQRSELYAAYILEIINRNLSLVDNKANQVIVSFAFSQLKDMVRSYWYKDGQSNIGQLNKICLMSSIIRTSFNISSINSQGLLYKYMKLLKDVIFVSCQDAITIYPEVVKSIQVSLHSESIIYLLPVYLNILLGLSTYSKQGYSKNYILMIKSVHPLLLEFVSKGDDRIQQLYNSFAQSSNQNQQFLAKYLQFKRKYEEILYQTLKLMCKAILRASTNELRSCLLPWVQIALKRIIYIDETFSLKLNQQRQGFVFDRNNIGSKGNDQFNYFHGKKWALKLVHLSMSRLLVYNQQNKELNKSTSIFYQRNFEEMVSIVSQVWNFRWPERIQKELLNFLQTFIEYKPRQLCSNHHSLLMRLQKLVLPPFMVLTQKQVSILKENPIEFISQQINLENRQSNRMIAANVWIKIAKIQYSYNPAIKRSIILRNSFALIKSWIYNLNPNDLPTRDNGCFLLLHLKEPFAQSQELFEEIQQLVNKVIMDNFAYMMQNDCFIIIVQALQLFNKYSALLSKDTFNLCKELILQIFYRYDHNARLKGEETLIMLRCCTAFHRLIKGNQEMKHAVGYDNIRMIIGKGLSLVQNTSFDEFIKEVISILGACVSEISDFAKEITKYIHNWFKHYSQKDIFSFMNDDAKSYNRNYIEIARGTLSILETLIYFVKKGNKEITKAIEKQIVSIIYYLFSRENPNELDEEIDQEAIWLLKSFLKSNSKEGNIDPQIMKICKIVIIKLAGLHRSIIVKLKQRVREQQDKKKIEQYTILINCSQMAHSGFQHYVGVIRNFIRFIKFGESIADDNPHILSSANYTECLAYLPYRFFSPKTDLAATDAGRCFSLLALIYYYEHHQQPNNQVRVHQTFNRFTLDVIKKTFHIYEYRPRFAKYNVQLFCLWIYEVKERLPLYFNDWTDQGIKSFFENIFIFGQKGDSFGLEQIQTYEQQIRCILGISTFVRLMRQYDELNKMMSEEVLANILKHVIDFASVRIQDEQKLTQLDWGSSQSEQNDQNVKKYSQLMENQFGHYATDNLTYSNELQYDYEDYEGEQQEFDEDCIRFEQCEDQDIENPLRSHNERLHLLLSLYQLQKIDPTRYWRIVKEQQCNEDIMQIAMSCQCFRENSQYSYLKGLCVMSKEMEEWQDIENDYS